MHLCLLLNSLEYFPVSFLSHTLSFASSFVFLPIRCYIYFTINVHVGSSVLPQCLFFSDCVMPQNFRSTRDQSSKLFLFFGFHLLMCMFVLFSESKMLACNIVMEVFFVLPFIFTCRSNNRSNQGPSPTICICSC